MANYRKVLDGTDNVTTSPEIRTKNPCVANYEQTKKGLYKFYPKRIVQSDGIHTLPLQV